MFTETIFAKPTKCTETENWRNVCANSSERQDASEEAPEEGVA